jgi:hypothetical protein
MEVNVLKEIKNARGEVKQKVVRVYNKTKSEGLKFDTINTLYQQLQNKYKPEEMTITAKPLDGGWTTLKPKNYYDNNLKYIDVEYYSSLPKDTQKKLIGKYYCVDIIIDL